MRGQQSPFLHLPDFQIFKYANINRDDEFLILVSSSEPQTCKWKMSQKVCRLQLALLNFGDTLEFLSFFYHQCSVKTITIITNHQEHKQCGLTCQSLKINNLVY